MSKRIIGCEIFRFAIVSLVSFAMSCCFGARLGPDSSYIGSTGSTAAEKFLFDPKRSKKLKA
jgi:hypothetical protein